MASVECARCGITPGDMPHEELGLTVEEMADLSFGSVDGETLCNGCALLAGGERDG